VPTALSRELEGRQLFGGKRFQQQLIFTGAGAVSERSLRPPLTAGSLRDKLPQSTAGRHIRWGLYLSFALFVICPMVAAGIYYGAIASKQYVAEFKFTVKDTSATASTIPKGLLTALGPSAGTGTENYLVADYLTSRQAVEDLQQRVNLTDLYSKPTVDWLSRFDAAKPMEQFVLYWQSMTTAYFDQITGITTAKVKAFSPEDALLVANTMVQLSEQLVNEMASRSQNDAVKFAEKELQKAQERLKRVRLQIMDGSKLAPSDALLLDLERQVAQTMLTTAMQTLDQTRASAATQHLYITPFVRPSLPQSSTYPRTLLATLTIGALAFGFWLIGLLTVRSIFERFS
jgi:capsule polysaccharide export protein KpsE/RkpR